MKENNISIKLRESEKKGKYIITSGYNGEEDGIEIIVKKLKLSEFIFYNRLKRMFKVSIQAFWDRNNNNKKYLEFSNKDEAIKAYEYIKDLVNDIK
jgi:hypothetical protein